MEDSRAQTGRKRCAKTAALNLLVLPIVYALCKRYDLRFTQGKSVLLVFDNRARDEGGCLSHPLCLGCPRHCIRRCGDILAEDDVVRDISAV